MPEAAFDKELNLPSDSGRYVKLSKKGDKIKFRIAATAHYETKHFLGGKEVTFCGKYNSDDHNASCKYCEDYQLAVDNGDTETAKQLKPSTTFYYPIVDLTNAKEPKARIFQFTAKGIHYTIGGYAKEGVDVFGCDWVVERTEEQGNYYKVLRLDSKLLSKEQNEALEQAKLLKLNRGLASSSIADESEGVSPEEAADIMGGEVQK